MLRRFGMVVAFILVGVYAAVALRGPQGVQALLGKREEIRRLQEENATLARENARKEERIRRLKNNPAEQEMEIRKRLKLLRPGEHSFILPELPKEAPKSSAPAAVPEMSPAQ